MQVYQLDLKAYLLKDIPLNKIQEKVSALIDKVLMQNAEMSAFHKNLGYKFYVLGGLTPIERDGTYRQEKIYTIQIRTVSEKLLNFFQTNLANGYSDALKALTVSVKKIPKKPIEKIYTLTPLILKFENGYWREIASLGEFERRLRENLIKKYNTITGQKCDENFELYIHLRLDNDFPISCPYKNITLLGDKATMMVAQNPIAQELAYLAIGCGLGENNARGNGFCGYKYI